MDGLIRCKKHVESKQIVNSPNKYVDPAMSSREDPGLFSKKVVILRVKLLIVNGIVNHIIPICATIKDAKIPLKS